MKKSKLDEMQEQKLLKIEHNGCWGAFWGLLAALLIQTLTGADLQSVAGEWLLFMALSLYLGVACVRAGIWDRRLEMNRKTNLIASLIGALVAGVFIFAYNYLRYHKPVGSLWSGGIVFLVTFVGCFVLLTLAARITKKRQAALEQEPEDVEEL